MPRISLLSECVDDFERKFILAELLRNAWNRAKTARELGISYRGLLYKIERFGLQPPAQATEETGRHSLQLSRAI